MQACRAYPCLLGCLGLFGVLLGACGSSISSVAAQQSTSTEKPPTGEHATPASSPAEGAANLAEPSTPSPVSTHRVRDLKITILSTTRAPRGVGEWGFSALVEADGHRILFDAGNGRDTVLRNANTLKVDLTTITDVVLSHHHDDHVGGLVHLREAVFERAPAALATVHVARGALTSRRHGQRNREINKLLKVRPAYEATGGVFRIHDAVAQIAPGVWVTGPVPRVHPERNWSGQRLLPSSAAAGGWVEDTLPESQSLVVDTDQGLVVLSGCGHAGIINTVTYVQQTIRQAPIHGAVGGFHLFEATDQHLQWTADALQAAGLQRFYGGHCTGKRAVYRFRTLLGLDPSAAQVAAVGGQFVLEPTPSAGAMAQ